MLLPALIYAPRAIPVPSSPPSIGTHLELLLRSLVKILQNLLVGRLREWQLLCGASHLVKSVVQISRDVAMIRRLTRLHHDRLLVYIVWSLLLLLLLCLLFVIGGTVL